MFPKSSIDLNKWIKENRHFFKPPVRNKVVWEDADTIVMVVEGPNSRKDYHVNQGEEFFYQIQGDIVLKVIDEGKARDIPIKQGEIFLLQSNVPHSPQRPANSIGLVIEQKGHGVERDGFQWYCEKCSDLLYEEFVEVTDIEKQLPQVFKKFYESEEKLRCKKCGHMMQPPPSLPTDDKLKVK